jgi:hypothetical protein
MDHGVMAWRTLGAVDPKALVESRVALHWAAQVPAALGHTRVPKAEDWSHYALAWLDGPQALVGRPVEDAGGLRAGVRPRDLALVVLERGGRRAVGALPLAGRTLQDGLDWVVATLAERSGTSAVPLESPPHEMPAHALARGAAFPAPDAGLAELARWYADAERALTRAAAGRAEAGPVIVWPHHFDAATLLTLAERTPAGDARTIGLGMSPGDEGYAEPYVYVKPWPAPDGVSLPALEGGGAWHRGGWLGAVLTGSAIVADRSTPAQERRVEGFLRSAEAAARTLVAASG